MLLTAQDNTLVLLILLYDSLLLALDIEAKFSLSQSFVASCSKALLAWLGNSYSPMFNTSALVFHLHAYSTLLSKFHHYTSHHLTASP